MADIAIETSAWTLTYLVSVRAGPFWTSPTVGYVIYTDASRDLKYRKTSDGGDNWSEVNIRTGTVALFDCWADWQTAGDAGTKIHIAYLDIATNDVRYVYLDTSDDSVAGDDQVEAAQGTGAMHAAENGGGWNFCSIAIEKAVGGNIDVACGYKDTNSVYFPIFYTSPDAATWTSKAAVLEADKDDIVQLYAGNETDNQDIWAAYWDQTASEISLKVFDDSGNSWSETSIAGSMTIDPGHYQMDGQIRISDKHLLFFAWNLKDNALADLMMWDINGAGSIVAKTNVLTDSAETVLVSVFINQVNDDIYVFYVRGTAWASLVQVFYKKSDDGGSTWGDETAMQADAEDDEKWISAGCMKAANGGKAQPFWHNDDLDDLFTNTDNGVSIAASVAGIGASYVRQNPLGINQYGPRIG